MGYFKKGDRLIVNHKALKGAGIAKYKRRTIDKLKLISEVQVTEVMGYPLDAMRVEVLVTEASAYEFKSPEFNEWSLLNEHLVVLNDPAQFYRPSEYPRTEIKAGDIIRPILDYERYGGIYSRKYANKLEKITEAKVLDTFEDRIEILPIRWRGDVPEGNRPTRILNPFNTLQHFRIIDTVQNRYMQQRAREKAAAVKNIKKPRNLVNILLDNVTRRDVPGNFPIAIFALIRENDFRWITANGEVLNYSELNNPHLLNITRYVEKKITKIKNGLDMFMSETRLMGTAEGKADIKELWAMSPEDWLATMPGYKALLYEIKRRDLTELYLQMRDRDGEVSTEKMEALLDEIMAAAETMEETAAEEPPGWQKYSDPTVEPDTPKQKFSATDPGTYDNYAEPDNYEDYGNYEDFPRDLILD